MTGMVMDILRCSLYDGPGIRTTVFLKGCTMHCAWCHNPEGFERGRSLRFDASRCTACGRCAAVCSQKVHTLLGAVHKVDRRTCKTCGQCVEACLTGALSLCGKEMSAEDVWAIVRKDLAYYRKTGGGLTLSGGEPLMQPAIAAQILETTKREDIHTAVETAGNVPWQAFEKVIPYTELFLFDYKLSSPDELARLTGGKYELMMDNLHRLASLGKPIWLRCPILPGINDNEEHFSHIRALRKRYPAIARTEIMPYHAFGISKWMELGMEAPYQGTVPGTEQISGWRRAIGENACGESHPKSAE